MEPSSGAERVRIQTVEFETADGVELQGDLARPADPVAAAIVCHPHPKYGGTRHDHVVDAVFAALPTIGVAALRFDFRREFGGGIDEVKDARAALAELRTELPDLPLVAIGYSFGAMVTLGLPEDEPGLAAKVLIAPPLTMADPAADTVSRPDLPVLVLSPVHDQFTPARAAEPIVARWPDATLEPIEMADHFLRGCTAVVVDGVANWLRRSLPPSPRGPRPSSAG